MLWLDAGNGLLAMLPSMPPTAQQRTPLNQHLTLANCRLQDTLGSAHMEGRAAALLPEEHRHGDSGMPSREILQSNAKQGVCILAQGRPPSPCVQHGSGKGMWTNLESAGALGRAAAAQTAAGCCTAAARRWRWAQAARRDEPPGAAWNCWRQPAHHRPSSRLLVLVLHAGVCRDC